MEINKDLIAASSTPIVLAILTEGDSYGYAILQRVKELSGGRMEWTDGMLYPVLHRLERLGLVEARWEVAETGRRRKYYRITSRGRTQLVEERRQWQAVDETLRGILRVLALCVPAMSMADQAMAAEAPAMCMADRAIATAAPAMATAAPPMSEAVPATSTPVPIVSTVVSLLSTLTGAPMRAASAHPLPQGA